MKVLNNIIFELNRNKKKQKDLTDYLGLQKNSFTEWKGGRSKSYMKYLPQIAEFLGVTVDYLLNTDENKNLPSAEPCYSLMHNKKNPDTSHDSEMSERDRDAARLYNALIASGYIRQGETLSPEQVGTLKAVITLLDSSFGKGEK